MSIKFKSFCDYRSHARATLRATKQAEEFIEENNIEYINIKDIKFSVDSEGDEHILLVYLEENNNEKQ